MHLFSQSLLVPFFIQLRKFPGIFTVLKCPITVLGRLWDAIHAIIVPYDMLGPSPPIQPPIHRRLPFLDDNLVFFP